MYAARATQVLVVANRTAATPWLLREIEQRAGAGPCEFALLVPPIGGRHPDWTLDVALSHIEVAAGGSVRTVECDRDYVGAVQRELGERDYDEVLISIRPPPGPRWLSPSPLRWLEKLTVAVTVVALDQRTRLDRGVLKVRSD
jgi:hypothetical protein